MASISLFTSSTVQPSTISTSRQASQQAAAQRAADAAETVKLSAAAQAKALYHQGRSVTAIAAALGTTAKEVDNYLGITLEEALSQTLESTLKA